MYTDREVGSLGRAITQAHGSNHIALAGCAVGVGLDLVENLLDLFHLQIDDVIHHALSAGHMLGKQVKVEVCLRSEGVLYITVKVDGNQAATVVGTQWDFATRIGRDGLETQVGIAVGN